MDVHFLDGTSGGNFRFNSFIPEKIKSQMESNTSLLVTKADLFATKDFLASEIAALGTDITKMGSSLIRWMFFFWITQMIATFGLLFLFLGK